MTTYPDDADGRVLADLVAHGVDMSQPLGIEFAVASPDESSSKAIADALEGSGYAAEIACDEGEPDETGDIEAGDIDMGDDEFGPSWTVYAVVSMVPEYQEIMRIQDELERLAAPHGGTSDGWGVMLE